jgi:hypothetical protein
MERLVKESILEHTNTVYFFLSYFFKARFNIIFPSVPRRVTSSLKDFIYNVDYVIFLRAQLFPFGIF